MTAASFLKDLARYLQASKMGTDWSNLKDADDEMLVNVLSMLCPFAPEEKQALLEAVTLPERRQILQTLIAFSLQSHGARRGDPAMTDTHAPIIDRRMLEALICPQTQGPTAL